MGVLRPNREDMRGGAALKKRGRALRSDMTDAERSLWRDLRLKQLDFRLRRQFPIPPYVVDFACVEARLIVECDGGQHAAPGDHERRDADLRRRGWFVLRFWNNEILDNRDGVLHTIAAALAGRHPHPDPPPPAGEGEPVLRGRTASPTRQHEKLS